MVYKIWGRDGIDEATLKQMDDATSLECVVGGALMPDAHLGYGLPIGGVLATKGEVLPYAVGVDIACQMRLTIAPIDVEDVGGDRLARILINETRFGAGASFEGPDRRLHPVMEKPEWGWLKLDRDRAWSQLGSSGGGNHFVEWGEVNGQLALLSHSGSRGVGHHVCTKYTKLATEGPEGDLQWFTPGSEAETEYLMAMELMGDYASANHDCIHEILWGCLGYRTSDLSVVSSVHNFAWWEDGLFVHRKGATPAQAGQEGVIPGTMTSASYIVLGKGNPESLHSASHGAGRAMGRRQAKRELCPEEWKRSLDIKLIGGSIDESQKAYKDIHQVIAAQDDLIEVTGQFLPKIVRMVS